MEICELKRYGWSETWENQYNEAVTEGKTGYIPARVISEHQHIYGLITEEGECLGRIAGKMRHAAKGKSDYPAVGDWVVVKRKKESESAVITAILPRRTRFARKLSGDALGEQVIAANIDMLFLVTGLNLNFSLRRIERYIALASQSGAEFAILLNKSDLCNNAVALLEDVNLIAPNVPVYLTSCQDKIGMDAVRALLKKGNTYAFLGSSGVGKSTMINELAGVDLRKTGEIRGGDDKGRHTTTNREMSVLPSGALVIDTPGLRELQLWDAEEGVKDAFEDIENIASGCRFRDCSHVSEPGCRVRLEVDTGKLSEERYANYIRMQGELSEATKKIKDTGLSAEKINTESVKRKRKRNGAGQPGKKK